MIQPYLLDIPTTDFNPFSPFIIAHNQIFALLKDIINTSISLLLGENETLPAKNDGILDF